MMVAGRTICGSNRCSSKVARCVVKLSVSAIVIAELWRKANANYDVTTDIYEAAELCSFGEFYILGHLIVW